MDKSALMRWWRYELQHTLCGGCDCSTCQLYLSIVTTELPAEAAVYEPILRLCFLPNTHWRTARRWIKAGCPPGALTAGYGWSAVAVPPAARTEGERGVA